MLLKLLRKGLGSLVIFLDFVTRPTPMKRSAEEQAKVDEQTRDMALYQFYACPFCIKTRRHMRRLNLNIELRNAQADGPGVAEHRQALLEQGGRIQVPCLRMKDESGEDVWMYESDQIIQYLDTRFGAAA